MKIALRAALPFLVGRRPPLLVGLLVAVACGPRTAGPAATGGQSGNGGAASGGAPGSAGAPGPRDGGDAASDGPGPARPADAALPGVSVPGQPVALPLVVTDHFPSQGWFGDGSVVASFKPGATTIRQVAGSGGPCATRPPGARGRCIEVTYTPPPGLVVPAGGGWVGVYFLRSLAQGHAEATPAARPGDPNWGLEPGLPVAPGATKISFFAAAAQAGTRVTFRAGTDKDTFVLPEQTETLTASWAPYSLQLASATYGSGVIGAFAWVLKDTSKPATFYLDGIVWEGGGVAPLVPPAGVRDGTRQFVIINACAQPVWVGTYGMPAVPEGGGFRLDAGQRRTVIMPGGKWTGRIWGRTGCDFDSGGEGGCDTGACGSRERCGGATGKTPVTLAELTLSGGGADPDFYDLSLVDGYNLPMAIAPLEGTYTRRPGVANDCLVPTCTHDLNSSCPAELRYVSAAGKVVGCLSACERFKTDEYCCAGAHDTPATCPPTSYSKTFKDACPTAYSYAYDDATSTFTCKGEDYAVWFCP